MHFLATTVNEKRFLSIDGVPRHGAVRNPGSPGFLDHVDDLDWFDDGEATQARSYDDPSPGDTGPGGSTRNPLAVFIFQRSTS
ncbi:hypothetical protein D9M72_285720 [compost metagenome]